MAHTPFALRTRGRQRHAMMETVLPSQPATFQPSALICENAIEKVCKSLLDSMISIVENDTLSHDMHQSKSKDEESAWEEEYDAPVGDEEEAAEVTAEGEESKHDDSTDDAMDGGANPSTNPSATVAEGEEAKDGEKDDAMDGRAAPSASPSANPSTNPSATEEEGGEAKDGEKDDAMDGGAAPSASPSVNTSTNPSEDGDVQMLLEKVNSDQPKTRDELNQLLRETEDRLGREDTNEAFASKLCATGGAAYFLVRISVVNTTWMFCVNKLLYLVPDYAPQLVKEGIYTRLLKFGGCKNPNARVQSRKIIIKLIKLLSTNPDGLDLGKIVAMHHGAVPFVAKGIEDNWSPHAESIFAKFDAAKKAQTWIQLEENFAARGDWGDWGKDSSGFPVYSSATLADLVKPGRHPAHGHWPIHTSVYPSVKDAHNQYRDNVIDEIIGAFKNDIDQPHMPSLVKAANTCGLRGTPSQVLERLAPHVKREYDRLKRYFDRDTSSELSKRETLRRQQRLAKLLKAYHMLFRPEERIKKQFVRVMPEGMLPPPPSPPPPPDVSKPAPALMPPGASAPPLALMPPAAAAAAVAPPPAMVASPPAAAAPPPPSLEEYLRRRVRPRTDCDKCDIARGPDASVRIEFGNGAKNKCASLKRACPLAAHAISLADDGVPLVEEYGRTFNVKNVKVEGKITKRKKFRHFMQNEYGVGPLGKDPYHKVTLYNPAGVSADLALEGCEVKLKLKFHAWTCTPTSEGGTKDNYMGFKIV